MLSKRIIPCLDVHGGRTVKGVNFVNLRDAGDPVELGARYAAQGADELVYLDISATHEGRNTFTDFVRRVARTLNIPFTVGGGIASVEDVERLLQAGADKVSINSAAVKHPALINQLSDRFGAQCIVVAIDIRNTGSTWRVHVNGGRISTDKEALAWARECADRGAGEILLTSMDHDGAKNGFALDVTARISAAVNIPVIASGGAGTAQHFADVLTSGRADAALAASVFHYNQIPLPQLKQFLHTKGIPTRLIATDYAA
jgi:cyclase